MISGLLYGYCKNKPTYTIPQQIKVSMSCILYLISCISYLLASPSSWRPYPLLLPPATCLPFPYVSTPRLCRISRDAAFHVQKVTVAAARALRRFMLSTASLPEVRDGGQLRVDRLSIVPAIVEPVYCFLCVLLTLKHDIYVTCRGSSH